MTLVVVSLREAFGVHSSASVLSYVHPVTSPPVSDYIAIGVSMPTPETLDLYAHALSAPRGRDVESALSNVLEIGTLALATAKLYVDHCLRNAISIALFLSPDFL